MTDEALNDQDDADDREDGPSKEEKAVHARALKNYTIARDHWRDNARGYEEDVAFARLEKQWDERLKKDRQASGLPCLTINKLPAFIRQVVNDARQNKPSIKVLPQDSGADPKTAEIYSGLIRNIESSSDADVAYDTAIDNAATGGFGFFRINTAYVSDDSFEQDLVFERIIDPLTVLPDPYSEAADSSDWSFCYVTKLYTKSQFKKQFPNAQPVDFNASDFPVEWMDNDRILVAEYWERLEIPREIVLVQSPFDSRVVDLEAFKTDPTLAGYEIQGEPRTVVNHKVMVHRVTGAGVISSQEWAGKHIPIIPVYGEEVVFEGKRHYRSLIRPARDSQIMVNAWESSATATVALAPRAPWIAEDGALDVDPNWQTANSASHPFLLYKKGATPPVRQPFAGLPAGDLQMALRASDNLKSTIGIFDAGIGARSNETSGRAIIARQRESDTSTFHFVDNLSRAIRCAGRILIDLIPKVYPPGRVVRILGEDGTPTTVKTGTPEEVQAQQQAAAQQLQDIQQIYALGSGRYDLTVAVGPSFNTRREEAASQMIEAARAFPGLFEVAGDIIAGSLDWPGADEIKQRLLQRMQATQQQQQAPREQQAQPDPAKVITAQTKQFEAQTKAAQGEQKLEIDGYNAETQRMRAVHQIQQPTRLPGLPAFPG